MSASCPSVQQYFSFHLSGCPFSTGIPPFYFIPKDALLARFLSFLVLEFDFSPALLFSPTHLPFANTNVVFFKGNINRQEHRELSFVLRVIKVEKPLWCVFAYAEVKEPLWVCHCLHHRLPAC